MASGCRPQPPARPGMPSLVVQVSRLQDGSRKIINISEVLGVKDERIDVHDFVFDRTGVTDSGKVQGRFLATGAHPQILERLRVSGITVPPGISQETLEVNV